MQSSLTDMELASPVASHKSSAGTGLTGSMEASSLREEVMEEQQIVAVAQPFGIKVRAGENIRETRLFEGGGQGYTQEGERTVERVFCGVQEIASQPPRPSRPMYMDCASFVVDGRMRACLPPP